MITLCSVASSKKACKAEHVPSASRARQEHEVPMLLCVCSCVTFPSQVHRRQTPSTSSSRSGRASLVSSVKTRHISWSSVSGWALEQGVCACVHKEAGASSARWGYGAPMGEMRSRGQCLCSCVTLPSQDQPLVDARAGHHPRVGAAQEGEVWRRRAL